MPFVYLIKFFVNQCFARFDSLVFKVKWEIFLVIGVP